MAEAGSTPTFKLVLVGDGGTGKVSMATPYHKQTTFTLETSTARGPRLIDYCRPPSLSDILPANLKRSTLQL